MTPAQDGHQPGDAAIAVAIVGYRSPPELIQRAVTGLSRQTRQPSVVLIHLNASDAAEAAALREAVLVAAADLVVDVTWSRSNLGFCHANNTLLSEAFSRGCTAVVVHNPDLLLADAALASLQDAIHEHGEQAFYGPLLELASPRSLEPEAAIDTAGIRWTWDCRHLDDRQGEPMTAADSSPRRVAGVSGACMLVPRAAYLLVTEKTGEFFDENFFAYREDAELGFRAGLLGVPSWLVPQARGWHVRGLRGGTRREDAFLDSLGVRNRFLLAAKYGRHRPGGRFGPLMRDVVVLAAVLLTERSSREGVREAWALRRTMRAKGAVVLAAATVSSRQAAWPRGLGQ